MDNNALFLLNIRSAFNVGAITRTAAAFNITTIYVGPQTPYPTTENDSRLPHVQANVTKKITKTSLGAESYVTYVPVNKIHETITQLKKQFFVIGLEQDKNSIELTKITKIIDSRPWLLLLGHEVTGLSETERKACDLLLEINHSTNKESLNVSVAAGIAIHWLQKCTSKQA